MSEFCKIGTVPETIKFGDVPDIPEPTGNEVVIDVKAASINVDDVPLLQDTAAGGWLYHARTPSAEDPLVGGTDYAGVVVAVSSRRESGAFLRSWTTYSYRACSSPPRPLLSPVRSRMPKAQGGRQSRGHHEGCRVPARDLG